MTFGHDRYRYECLIQCAQSRGAPHQKTKEENTDTMLLLQ